MFYDEEDNEENVIIIDIGSDSCKVGLSRDCDPKVIPTCIGTTNTNNYFEFGLKNAQFVGKNAIIKRRTSRLFFPVEQGIISSFDGIERIFDNIFKEELKISPEEYNMILTEPCFNPKENREKIAHILFDKYSVPALYIANQAVLSLNSTGRSTGISIESGDGITQIAPIFDNFYLPHAAKKIDFTGKALTEFMFSLLNEGKVQFTEKDKILIKSIKEEVCYVAENYENEIPYVKPYSYTLPDGTKIVIKEQRIKCPELIFSPNKMNQGKEGIAEVCNNAIQKCDEDIRRDLYSNIIISGGNTKFKGFEKRFSFEFKKLIPIYRVFEVIDVKDKINAVWEGAKLISKFIQKESSWLTRQEYEENGERILHSKFF